jgi:hypothetical protein
MANSILLVLLSLLLLAVTALAASASSDTLTKGRNITDGDKLVSAGGSFTLGFFSAGVPKKRYLGVWFSISEDAICWVANRDRPLADTSGSGALVITDAGSLLLVDGSGQVVWSSNTTGAAAPASARLLESGNLVVLSDPSSSAVLWQSFNHPSNTLLPGMKIGKNLWTGAEWYLSSWRSAGDPSPGRYRYTIDTRGVPGNVLWDGDVERYRTGLWNGLWFSGVPEMTTYSDMFRYDLTVSPGEITYGYVAKPGAPFSHLLLTDDGAVQRLVWDAKTRAWNSFFQGPRDVCDAYGKCGAFGVCDAGAASTSFCSCVRGVQPRVPGGVEDEGGLEPVPSKHGAGLRRERDGGVRVLEAAGGEAPRHEQRVCGHGRHVGGVRREVPGQLLLRGLRPRGGAGSGCIMRTDGLVDLRSVDGGQDIYLRSAKSELGMSTSKPVNLFCISLLLFYHLHDEFSDC